ncbi:hypothetical protein SEPCBS57363_006652 [Sporothrix epigloea]|uniref:Uncharacterized protein n=1 Tax=Sporothrix epigloea TaxID=1892477 RepID=A0ABP0E5I2_9PEZI
MRSVASLLAASGLVQLVSAAACKPHFCRDAILGAPGGIDDCNVFLLTTVILPVVTVYSTPTSAVTKTHTRTIEETETDSYTSNFQPSVAIWSTYTSVDVVHSVTHTTKKLITTTTSPKFTKTTTTALATTTSTTTTMTTTKHFPKKRQEQAQPETISNSVIPDYASACSYASVYTSNCLQLGATTSVTTISPVDSLVLSSVLVSTASADSSVYVSSTITQTTVKTLPSLHSTKTVESTTTSVISTSTTTLYTKTATHLSLGIKVSTLATTTTTTTLVTASPTPYVIKVTSSDSSPSLKNSFLDWISRAYNPILGSNGYTATYAIGFTDSFDANVFVLTPQGLAVIIQTWSGTKLINTPYYLTVDSNGYVVPNSAPSATDSIINCSLTNSGGSLTLSGCNYYLGAHQFGSGIGALHILTASSTVDSGFAFTLFVDSY